ncbi:MAG: type I glyceraldehyde-3-phosphate dehydrogenase [Chloroflexi bacterium]|nr:type I glyceraldehyde-3-phosphate dehydrogenase [Chloroflexota bacterium]MBU1751871.1 type I glyceraldehyde-3-phosphate dehydrogenase [Chloroflexota bacterium]
MAVKVGLNGFGRTGRQVVKAIIEKYPGELELAAISVGRSAKTEARAHLLKYDSNYGKFPHTVETQGDNLVIDGQVIPILTGATPADIPWADYGVDIVVESSGLYRKAEDARGHITAGAKKVVIGAPAKGEDLTVVMGVNEDSYDPATHHIISNASCTTNCLAPVAKVVNDEFGIIKGLMTTIHAYTNDQQILDKTHKDPRRARAAALSIIPTTTGAAQAVALVIPDLKGKFDGYALRVPTPTVSIVDFTAQVSRPTTAEEVNAALRRAADGPMKGILGVSDEPLVSVDYRGDERSSIVDAALTKVIGGDLVKVVTWYDNEWAYSMRCADLCAYMAKRGL